MAMTPKQERNGVPGPGATAVSAVPSVSDEATVASEMGASQAAADRVMVEAHALMTSPAGSSQAGLVVGAQGALFEWDSGLAVDDSHEAPGNP